MIIAGAKGFAKEVLEVYSQLNKTDNIVFFDDYSNDLGDTLYDTFKILKTIPELQDYIKTIDNRFVLGVGTPQLRKLLTEKLNAMGGVLVSIISPHARIGDFGNSIGVGSSIMTGVVITNDVSIGKGCLINLKSTIGHDSTLGEFVELSPNVNISGRCHIGSFTSIGTGATVIPDVVIGTNCIVAAGAVVTKNMPDNCMIAGVPAVIKKEFKK